MFKFFTGNGLKSNNQSVLNQLTHLLISSRSTHQIYRSFDDGQEVRFVFLDISKTFEKVCHKSLIFKLSYQSTFKKQKFKILCIFAAALEKQPFRNVVKK